jgi:murein L,D-transpeptidase YcbB/YkuD
MAPSASPYSASNRIDGRLRCVVRLLAIMALWAAPAAVGSTALSDDTIARKLQARIAAAQTANYLVCVEELVCGIAELPRFYAQRNFRPAWTTADDRAFALADEMVQQLEDARYDGLAPQHYHLDSIRSLLHTARQQVAAGRPLDADVHADLEFLLTDAFLMLGSHLQAGRVNPETLDSEWLIHLDRRGDLAQVLDRAIESRRIGEALDGLRPPHPEYAVLRQALKFHRTRGATADGPRLPEKSAWEKGQRGEIADRLRERLQFSGDLPQNVEGVDADADAELFEGLRRFQDRHGLEADGRMGPRTLQALNVSGEERIRQVELNLERWRWLPHDLGSRHVRVNVPQFDLAVIEDGQELLRMRVVVGRHYRRTPVFSSYLDHLVFNPAWNIPARIAVEDILPKARRDPSYLRHANIRVYESWSPGAAEIEPDSVDWTAVAGQRFSYKFKKDPGPHNDLGRIKFMFPNKFAVYLHDTPSKRLFDRGMRGFSSGCIRIEKPIDLAEYVLRDSPGWSRDAVIAAIDSGANRTARLPHPIALHLIYMTAGVNSEGRLRFWPDIYQRDSTLDRALQKKPPRDSGLSGT